jgi:Nitrate and nitrite sensing/Histidine kinase-, DNA gyrase B-, and HSP90-like ATPase/HAMP domain
MIRNMQIRSKLIAVLVVPLVALTVLAAIGIGANVARGVQADRVNDQTAFAVSLSTLVHELQRERDLSAGWVGSGRDAGYGGVVAQRVAVNQALQTFRRDIANLGTDNSGSFQRRIDTALKQFNQLNEDRQRIEDEPGWTVQRTLDLYSGMIADLFAVELEIGGQTNDRSLIHNIATFVALGRYKEAASQERGLVYAVASAGQFAPGEFQRFATSLGAQDTWRSQFDINATDSQRSRLDELQGNSDVIATNELRNYLRNALLTGNATSKVDLDPKEWFLRTTARIDLLRGVENTVAADVSAASKAAQSSASRQALLYTIVLALVLWLTVGLSLWMARSMVGPLRTLTKSANEVADQRLPGLVDQLQHTKDPRELDVVPEPVPVTSGDEIGQVSAAFNSVHRVAIRVATEQAALRRSIGDMFLNLARRSQTLIDRQLELIDDLERTEADPDALENLFKLDHLATRMRRNAEDLIVLSGAEPARRWSQPVPLVEVVRAALAEVEDYNRVELLPIDEIGVAGQAVSDVVHLLAELIENATSFSPPGTKVQVAGQQVSNGYVLEIEDRGLGMSDEELVEANERLANPPMVDFALSRMLGLYVVARLAQRYNIKVQLRHSWYGGITALVLLPPTVAVRAPMPEALEAPSRRGPAELVASTKPVEPAADESGEHLPIFEAARSDWFEDAVQGDHLPLRRHAAQQPNSRAAEPTGNGAGTLTGAGTPRTAGPAPDGGFGLGGPQPDGQPGPARPEPADAEAARVDAARAEALRAEAMRVEAARIEAARAEAPPAEALPTEAAPAGPPPGPAARAEPGPDARAEPGPTARTDTRSRRDRTGPRGRTGPLPTRTPGASGPPPGGATPFVAAPSPGDGQPLAPAPASPAPPSRSSRRADRTGQPAAAQGATRAQGTAPTSAPDAPAPAPATLQAASVQTTKAGLPRRVPRANLAPGMVAARTAAAAATPAPASSSSEPSTASTARSPEEVRSMLSSYRSGLERGRMMAAGEDADRGGDAHSSSRSDDDDATQ